MNRCLITGCILYDDSQAKWIRGDLHEFGSLGEVNIFNAVGKWAYGDYYSLPYETAKIITVNYYWERRNVIVFLAESASFNPAAVAYTTEAE